MSFKILAFAPQISIKDAAGRDVFFVHQKVFKLKEDVAVYSDPAKTRQVYRIQADRVFDFSARYTFTDANGQTVGAVKREGMRSIFKASYNIFDTGESMTHHISEDNGWIRVADIVMESIPIVGMFAGYLFHPSYTVYEKGTERGLMRLTKKPAFFEGSFEIAALEQGLSPDAETKLLLSYMMMILLERQRG
jgi:uncharacterized protein YxjI